MTEFIVDTNVAVVANQQNAAVAANCVDACTIFITAVRNGHIVLIDDDDAVRLEYAKALRQGRPYGLGTLFLQHIYQHQYNPAHVRRVALPVNVNGEYVDFPDEPALAAFDPSDRKFAALARRTNVPVTNAVDSDWVDGMAALTAHGITVEFLCGRDKEGWFTP